MADIIRIFFRTFGYHFIGKYMNLFIGMIGAIFVRQVFFHYFG